MADQACPPCSHHARLPNSYWIRTSHTPGAVQGSLRNPQLKCVLLQLQSGRLGIWASNLLSVDQSELWPCSNLTSTIWNLGGASSLHIHTPLSSRVGHGQGSCHLPAAYLLVTERMYRPNGILFRIPSKFHLPCCCLRGICSAFLGWKLSLEADGCLLCINKYNTVSESSGIKRCCSHEAVDQASRKL